MENLEEDQAKGTTSAKTCINCLRLLISYLSTYFLHVIYFFLQRKIQFSKVDTQDEIVYCSWK